MSFDDDSSSDDFDVDDTDFDDDEDLYVDDDDDDDFYVDIDDDDDDHSSNVLVYGTRDGKSDVDGISEFSSNIQLLRRRRLEAERRAKIEKARREAEAKTKVRNPTRDAFFEKINEIFRRKPKDDLDNIDGSFESYPHLLALRPKEVMIFHSDYFTIDDYYCCILNFFSQETTDQDFDPFWGINRFTCELPPDVITVMIEQVSRRPKSWVEAKQRTNTRLQDLSAREDADGGGSDARSRNKSKKLGVDFEEIIYELDSLNASYLHVHNRLMLKAKSLESLEKSIERINLHLSSCLKGVSVAPYEGEQRRELSAITSRNIEKRGKGFGFTSTQYAGSYSIVTNGLSDRDGQYVGRLVAEVSDSAIHFAVNRFKARVVIASGDINAALGRSHVSDMWGSKISQETMMGGHRVVHLILNNCDLDLLGPKFSDITTTIDMNSGDVNPLEIFGQRGDELKLFPSHLEKLVLMTEQLSPPTENMKSLIRGQLKDILIDFYTDKRMWYKNPEANRKRLRLVGLRHDQVPTLSHLYMYIKEASRAASISNSTDSDMRRVYKELAITYSNLLSANGDLFNVHTSDAIDDTKSSMRIVYNFSELADRGSNIAMAQLVNIVSFAVNSLQQEDTLIIHGADKIDESIKGYLGTQFNELINRGGRIVFCYDSVSAMLDDAEFNQFISGDWTLMGTMPWNLMKKYQDLINVSVPQDLVNSITEEGSGYMYLRRNPINVIFSPELSLGIDPGFLEPRGIIPEHIKRQREGTLNMSARAIRNLKKRERGELEDVNDVTITYDDPALSMGEDASMYIEEDSGVLEPDRSPRSSTRLLEPTSVVTQRERKAQFRQQITSTGRGRLSG